MADAHSLRVQNANYDKVGYFIEKMLSESDQFCGCHRCKLDAVALALNTLPPHYYVDADHTNKTEIGSPWVLIEVAVREALERVSLNPHHDLPGSNDEEKAPRRLFG